MSDLIHSLVLSLRETAAEMNGSCTIILPVPVKESVPGEGGSQREVGPLLLSQLNAWRLLNFTYRNTLTNKYGRAIRQFDVIWTALKCVFLYSPKSPFLQWSGRAKEEKSMCFPVLKQSNVRWCLQDAQLEPEGCDSSRHLRSCLGTQTPGRTMRR